MYHTCILNSLMDDILFYLTTQDDGSIYVIKVCKMNIDKEIEF